jgi:hypothetical protein
VVGRRRFHELCVRRPGRIDHSRISRVIDSSRE